MFIIAYVFFNYSVVKQKLTRIFHSEKLHTTVVCVKSIARVSARVLLLMVSVVRGRERDSFFFYKNIYYTLCPVDIMSDKFSPLFLSYTSQFIIRAHIYLYA